VRCCGVGCKGGRSAGGLYGLSASRDVGWRGVSKVEKERKRRGVLVQAITRRVRSPFTHVPLALSHQLLTLRIPSPSPPIHSSNITGLFTTCIILPLVPAVSTKGNVGFSGSYPGTKTPLAMASSILARKIRRARYPL
jgi:hypothetical protein